jgi:transcriptional regulator with XRE-family HTH domain
MSKAGRPRVVSKSAKTSPLSEFLDAHWGSTGLTNDVAASKFGFMAPNTISQWRTGRSAVPISRLPKIAELLRVDLVPLFLLWLRQARLRNDVVPATLIEVLDRRLVSANEAEVIKTLRHATRNSDPALSAAVHSAIALAVTK